MSLRTQGRIFASAILTALGAITVMASVASAQWLEVIDSSEKVITANLKINAAVHKEIILDVPSKNLEILCLKTEANDILAISGSNPPEATGTLLYSECKVIQNKVLQSNCLVDHITIGFKAKAILHSGKGFILFEPPTGPTGSFGLAKLLGELCALPESNEIKGTVVAECLTTALVEKDCNLTPAVTHLLQEALNHSMLFPRPTHGLTYGSGNVDANVLGIGSATLSTGANWSVHV